MTNYKPLIHPRRIRRPLRESEPIGAASWGPPEEQWVRGFCLVGCNRTDVSVTMVGAVTGSGVTMPLYACRECLNDFAELRMMWQRIRDGLAERSALYELAGVVAARRSAREVAPRREPSEIEAEDVRYFDPLTVPQTYL